MKLNEWMVPDQGTSRGSRNTWRPHSALSPLSLADWRVALESVAGARLRVITVCVSAPLHPPSSQHGIPGAPTKPALGRVSPESPLLSLWPGQLYSQSPSGLGPSRRWPTGQAPRLWCQLLPKMLSQVTPGSHSGCINPTSESAP